MSACAQQHIPATADTATSLRETLKDYWVLTKPEINFLVVATSLAGFYVGKQSTLHLGLLLNTLMGTVLVASGTATLNQYMERSGDAQMRRTGRRPLPSGRMAPWKALSFGLLISIVGAVELWFWANPLASVLAAVTLLSYLLIYTPLKRKTAWCTFLGAFPGAVPPLIGWAAARGSLDPQAWILFSIVFLWQFPHFLAIAWLYRDDYRRAGLHMVPREKDGGLFAAYEIVVLTIALVGITILPAMLHYEGRIYLVGALIAGAYFLFEASRMLSRRSLPTARRLLHVSVMYLPLLFALMMVDKLPW